MLKLIATLLASTDIVLFWTQTKNSVLSTVPKSSSTALSAANEYVSKTPLFCGPDESPSSVGYTVKAITTNKSNGASIEMGYVVRFGTREIAFVAGFPWACIAAKQVTTTNSIPQAPMLTDFADLDVVDRLYTVPTIQANLKDFLSSTGYSLDNYRSVIESSNWMTTWSNYMNSRGYSTIWRCGGN